MKNYNNQQFLINTVKYEEDTLRAQILSTEKFIILTQPKICSSYIGSQFSKIKKINESTPPWVKFNATDLSIKRFDMGEDYPKLILDEVESDWKDILSKKSKKDIILLVRHPMKRFTSAFFQDIIRDMINPKTDSKRELLLSLLKSEISNSRYDEVEEIIYSDTDSDSWVYHNSEVDIDIARIICRYTLNEFKERELSAEISHNVYYLYKYYHFINSINSTKIKVVDIDEVDVSKFLNRYDLHNFPKGKDNNSYNWKSQIYHTLVNDFPELHEAVCRDLQTELYFYNIIKHSSNYIVSNGN